MENEKKYLRKALKTLGLDGLRKTLESIKDVEEKIALFERNLVVLTHNLEITRENIRIGKGNVIHYNEKIEKYKGWLIDDQAELSNKERDNIKENIANEEYELSEQLERLEKEKSDLIELPKRIEKDTKVLENHLLKILPQMKVERLKELNKGKKLNYYIN